MADQTARRLVALLGRLTPGSRTRISDLAAELDTSEATLASDLMTLALCGVPPFDPDALMPLIVEDGYVEVWSELPASLGTVRLCASEAAALAMALQVAGFGPGDGLTRRLLEAAAATGFDAGELERSIRARSGLHEAPVYQTLAAAVSAHEAVRIEYVKPDAAAPSTREIEPVALFAERGAWYTTAWCRHAGAWRTFRVERIRCAAQTGEPATHRATPPFGTDGALAVEDLPLATLEFAASERFDERDWPGAVVREKRDDGSCIVEIAFAGTAWIARRVVARLGAVRVLEPAEMRAAVRALASREAARYED